MPKKPVKLERDLWWARLQGGGRVTTTKRRLLISFEIEAGEEACENCEWGNIDQDGDLYCEHWHHYTFGDRLPECLAAEERAEGEGELLRGRAIAKAKGGK